MPQRLYSAGEETPRRSAASHQHAADHLGEEGDDQRRLDCLRAEAHLQGAAERVVADGGNTADA